MSRFKYLVLHLLTELSILLVVAAVVMANIIFAAYPSEVGAYLDNIQAFKTMSIEEIHKWINH